MHHGNGVADRRGHEVDLGHGGVLERVLQNDHREDRGARGDVAGARSHGVGGDHAGAGVALGRAERATGLEVAVDVEERRTLGSEVAGALARDQDLGQQVLDLPAHALGGDELVELGDHGRVVVVRLGVDGEHARGVADREDLLAREAPVRVTGERGEEVDAGDVLLAVEDGLVDMANAPALGRVERKELGELVGRLRGGGVAPGAERDEQVAVGVEGQVAVHHGGDTEGAHALEGDAVLLGDVGLHRGVRRGETREDLLVAVGPVAVDQGVLPVEGADGDRLVVGAHEHRLDARGAVLDAQRRVAGLDIGDDLVFGHVRLPLSAEEWPRPQAGRGRFRFSRACARSHAAPAPSGSRPRRA